MDKVKKKTGYTVFLRQRSVKFLFFGALNTLANVLLIVILVHFLNLTTPLSRSLANIFATEFCLLLSFFCYRQFVWQLGKLDWSNILYRELLKYHLSVAWIITIRIFLIFPLLDLSGVHPALNTAIGIALGAALSYRLSEKFVFNNRPKDKS